ncbi:MAG: DUF4178 domain-containing protein, partial [Actinobacteria bacterium]|nr:DUF4178 domain-containing protein [Actinomycetota bacterium]
VFVVPMVAAGLILRRRGAAEEIDAAAFEQRRKLFEQDKIFRQLMRRESHVAADLLEGMATGSEGKAGESLRQARLALARLGEAASEAISEATWLEAAPLDPRDARNVARYDDLLLAGIRQIRESTGGGQRLDAATAQELLGLAHSAQRQFALRQYLVLRGRSLPASSPLHLLKGEAPERGRIAPESLRPGAAVSLGRDDYLVTAHLTYFAEGREWYALALRGEDGERRLQVEPGADEVLFMEPAKTSDLPGKVEQSGTASVSVDGLGSGAEGVVVDYRRTLGEDGLTGWWERWPEGERAYVGRRIGLNELQLWPAAVGGE